MANHFSALKRARQTDKRTAVNRSNKTLLRSSLRKLRTAITSGDKNSALAAYRETVSVIDKSVKKGVIHKNNAARRKSRLMKQLAASSK
jgi:small subunit ribosomal protein S20